LTVLINAFAILIDVIVQFFRGIKIFSEFISLFYSIFVTFFPRFLVSCILVGNSFILGFLGKIAVFRNGTLEIGGSPIFGIVLSDGVKDNLHRLVHSLDD